MNKRPRRKDPQAYVQQAVVLSEAGGGEQIEAHRRNQVIVLRRPDIGAVMVIAGLQVEAKPSSTRGWSAGMGRRRQVHPELDQDRANHGQVEGLFEEVEQTQETIGDIGLQVKS